ncbi:ATP-binding cassette domain-containing protein [Microbacterium sp. PAMC22086]|uniref:ATP-binding cassette domain-containing protein n=1 Tax=Microbacterium sp. PAMC22086 TaxID=2861281 RepID=UPI0021591684|nr:ATP-binding cassette domain-containing protein [Microbacterium sp. PAMC22086]
MTTVIATQDLAKHYGTVYALDGLDLTVEHGQVHGFLGPNGAGKSTAIRILLGLARRTSGQATVFGEDPWERAVDLHRRIAYVPGDVSVWPNLSGGEAVDLLARLRGARTNDPGYQREKKRLLDAFQFDPRKKGRAYSKGNRQKVALIAAFAVPADLYIFDEPTSGLDPLMAVIFQHEVARAHANGATVLLSSHIMSEVEQLCDRVMMALIAAPAGGYTASQLGERLGVSAAAVSGAVRYLQQLHFVQRRSRPGERRDRYEFVHDPFTTSIAGNMPVYFRLSAYIDDIAAAHTDDQGAHDRAVELAEFFRFLSARMLQIVDDWHEQRRETDPS